MFIKRTPRQALSFDGRQPLAGAGFVLYDRKRGDPADRMSEVIIGEGESFEAALRRFNKKIQQAGILAEARRREYYERPAARRKRKEAKRRKR